MAVVSNDFGLQLSLHPPTTAPSTNKISISTHKKKARCL
uniref:Uncharacterized protein n=1 Tax=Anguilla anguilla TaxID=7936 RepID=A0A0E9RI18_ANGAN